MDWREVEWESGRGKEGRKMGGWVRVGEWEEDGQVGKSGRKKGGCVWVDANQSKPHYCEAYTF